MARALRPLRSRRSNRPRDLRRLSFTANAVLRVALASGVMGLCGATPATAEAPPRDASIGSASGQPRFLALGDLPGGRFDSRATSVSADGRVIVGASVIDDAGREAAFRWSSETGMVSIGDLDGGARLSRALAVSPDGSSIAGTSHSRAGKEAFLWRADTGMLGLGDLPNGIFSSEGMSVSQAGRFVIGTSQSILGVRTAARAFRWTRETGMVDLGLPDTSRAAKAFDLSDDGRTIVGQVTDQKGRPLAHLWTEGPTDSERAPGHETAIFTGQSLGDLPGGRSDSVATATNADGSVVVGTGHGPRGTEAFLWTRRNGLRGLGALRGGAHDSRAADVSGDGSQIVGSADSERGTTAFLWTRERGMRTIEAALAAEGAPVPDGWHLEVAHGISRDGHTIVGAGTNPRGDREAWAISWPRQDDSFRARSDRDATLALASD